ncbi:DUF2461 domain-containing protein [candidate division KSB1 bacterium]
MAAFKGFPREIVNFFQELSANNSKVWFNEHKDEYENYVLTPSQEFVVAIADLLKPIAQEINGDPRINKSIFRIYRDTRFSKDKTPYKTHLGIYFWEGYRKKMENPGYYFHLEPSQLGLHAGMHILEKQYLQEYRDSVVHPKHGAGLDKAVKKVLAAGIYEVAGAKYKRTPKGYDPEHKYSNYLLNKGMFASFRTEIPEEIFTDKCVDYCFDKFKGMSPIQHWIVNMMKRI